MSTDPSLNELVTLMKHKRSTLSDSELEARARQLVELYKVLVFEPPKDGAPESQPPQ